MKEIISNLISEKLGRKISLESPKDRSLAHFALPCFSFAKELKKSPTAIAAEFAEKFSHMSEFASVSAVNAYVNFKLSAQFLESQAAAALAAPERFGAEEPCEQKPSYLLEYISANPTGPLHIGHARGAIYGDCLKRVARHLGHRFDTEYYVNDAGNQIDLLGTSVVLAIRDFVLHEVVDYPEAFYGGEYMQELAPRAYELFKDRLEDTAAIAAWAKDEVLREIKQTLKNARIELETYASESAYVPALAATLEKLREKDAVYEKDGKTWLRSTAYGDDQDRVIVREDGRGTYLAADIVYHHDKLSRGYAQNINIWGADHHGYIARVKAAMSALGHAPEELEVILAQMVNLLRDGQPYKMSKRKGNVILFSDVLADIGVDAMRYLFASRRCDSPLEFDVDEFKRRDASNPVFYINYAHARICQLFAKAGRSLEEAAALPAISAQISPAAQDLLFDALSLNAVLREAFASRSLNKICDYLRALAASFHKFYNETRIVAEPLEGEYLRVLAIVALCIKTALGLLGIEAATRMEHEG